MSHKKIVAVCFHGLVGSKIGVGGIGEAIPVDIGWNSIKNIFFGKDVEIHVFVHSWSIEQKYSISKVLEPKLMTLESQKTFNVEVKAKDSSSFLKRIKLGMSEAIKSWADASYANNKKNSIMRHYSRWYSAKQVLNLKRQYEEQNNIVYDFVLLTRFDVEFYSNIELDSLQKDCFYAAHWNDFPRPENRFELNYKNNYKGEGFLDLWFLSSSEMMDRFGKLFDKICDYPLNPHLASFCHAIEEFGPAKIKYKLFRWVDFEMIRAKRYGVLPPHGGDGVLQKLKSKFHKLLLGNS